MMWYVSYKRERRRRREKCQLKISVIISRLFRVAWRAKSVIAIKEWNFYGRSGGKTKRKIETEHTTQHVISRCGKDKTSCETASTLFPVLPPKVMTTFTRRLGMLRDTYLAPHSANYVIAQNGRTSIIHKTFARDKQVKETSSRPTITKEKLPFLDVSLPGVAWALCSTSFYEERPQTPQPICKKIINNHDNSKNL